MKTVTVALALIAAIAIVALLTQKKETMKDLRTEIIIDASAKEVWKVLTDFNSYTEWNPFIQSIEGETEIDSKLRASLSANGMKPMVIKPSVTDLKVNERFEWLGTTPLNFFNGRHYFEIEKIDDNQIKFIQGEHFTGWLAKLIMKKIGANTQAGFIAMNRALKKRVEDKLASK